MELRSYQTESIDAVMSAFDRGVTRALVSMHTGAGKTVVFCRLASLMAGRTLIIAPMRELVWQAADKVREINGDYADIEMADYRSNATFPERVVVASKQTLLSTSGGKKRYQKFLDIELVIVDEAHMQCSPAVVAMLNYFVDRGAKVVGFTATPFRMDGQPLLG